MPSSLKLSVFRDPAVVSRAPLTFQQRWLWELLQHQPDWRCTVTYTYRLKGALSIPALEKSIDVVLRRHGGLRVRIVTPGGAPTLQIEAPGIYRLQRVPITGNSGAEVEANARKWVEALSAQKVDPLVGPLFAVQLLELAEHEHWLVLAMHRLIGDCASIDQVFRELWLVHAEFTHNRPSPFTAEPPQYGDYAVQQEQSDAQWQSRHGDYWRERLAGAGPVRWATDATPSEAPRAALGRMSTLLGDTVSTGLRNLARQARTLSANVMLAVYVAVLWHWHGHNDFVVPFFTAGRQSGQKSVVGYFSHILYLRMQLTREETFAQLLSRVGNEFFRALSHQDFGRIATRHPELLAGAFFQWVTWHPDEVMEPIEPVTPAAPMLTSERVIFSDFAEDLTAIPPGMVAVEVTFFDTRDGIYASGVYRADLFSADTMGRFLTELRSASEYFTRNPNAAIAALPCY